jgi:hypothetical protein
MDDFFSNLARQVLGSQPELGPLLPPRFAAWPDLSLVSPPAQAPEPVDQPATAEAALFPPPLIDPELLDSDMPLPTFRQLSQVGSGPGPSIQPDVPPGPQDMLETADAGQNDIRQAVGTPAGVAADGSLPGAHPATSQPAAIGQATEPLSAPAATGHDYPAAGEAERAAETSLTPLVPEPALELPATPGPTPIAQRQGAAEATRAGRLSPASTAPHTPPRPGQGRTTAPPVSGGDQSTALEGPLAGVGFSPGYDRPTPNTPGAPRRRADMAQGDQSPSISPLQPASPYQPGDLSPGQAGPTESPPLGAEGRPAAPRDPAAAVQENQRADTPLKPLVHEPASQPPATPGPEPVVQRQVAPLGVTASGALPPPPASTVTATPGPRPAAVPPLGESRTGRAETIEPLDRRAAEPEFGSVPVPLPDSRLTPPKGAPHQVEQPLTPLVAQPDPPAPAEAAASLTALAPEPATWPPQPILAAGQRAVNPRRRQVPEAGRAAPRSREPTIVPIPEPSPADRLPFTAERLAWPAAGQAEPLPTVRVTIGRIEVRTAPPPPVSLAPRPRPARTALSLDDYLKAGPGGEP